MRTWSAAANGMSQFQEGILLAVGDYTLQWMARFGTLPADCSTGLKNQFVRFE